jgi:hypothetical protein
MLADTKAVSLRSDAGEPPAAKRDTPQELPQRPAEVPTAPEEATSRRRR